MSNCVNSLGAFRAVSTYSLTKNQKYRIVQVINTAGNYLYIDGVLNKFTANATGKLTNTQNSAFTTLRIGSHNPTISTRAAQFFGNISNFRIWDRSLSAQEVALA